MPKTSSKKTISKRVNRLEKLTRPEVKFNQDESGAFDGVGAISGTLLNPTALAESVGRNGRIGDKVKSRNIRFQAIFKMADNASASTCALRILVLRSKVSFPSTSQMPTWYGSVDEDKFFVVKDILTQVSSRAINNPASGGEFRKGSTLKKIKFNIPMGMRKLQYDGGSLQSPVNNEYVIYMLAENGNAEVAYNWQHYYIDN